LHHTSGRADADADTYRPSETKPRRRAFTQGKRGVRRTRLLFLLLQSARESISGNHVQFDPLRTLLSRLAQLSSNEATA